MQQQVLEYHRPLRRERFGRISRSVAGAACSVFRTGSRAGAIAQVCIAVACNVSPRGEAASIAMIFWFREALIATAFALLWALCPRNERRRHAVAFLVANALGLAFTALMPRLNY